MATLYARAKAFAKKYPKPTTGEASWDQMCGTLMYRFCSSLGAFAPAKTGPNAVTVRASSHIVSEDASKAPIGAFHWWSIGANGHVGIDTKGKGKYVFMATTAVTGVLGRAIGISSVANYTKVKHATYKGWSRDYAGAHVHLDGTSTAGTGGTVVLPPTTTKGKGMFFQVDHKFWVLFEGGIWYTIKSHAIAMIVKARYGESTDITSAELADLKTVFPTTTTTTNSTPDSNSAWLVRVVRAIGAAITGTK